MTAPEFCTSRYESLTNVDDVVVERPILEMMTHARHARTIRVINGLKRGNLTRALAGEDVGTVIVAD